MNSPPRSPGSPHLHSAMQPAEPMQETASRCTHADSIEPLNQMMAEVSLGPHSLAEYAQQLEQRYIEITYPEKKIATAAERSEQRRASRLKELFLLEDKMPPQMARYRTNLRRLPHNYIRRLLMSPPESASEDFTNPELTALVEECCQPVLAQSLSEPLLQTIKFWLLSPLFSPLSPDRRNLIESLGDLQQFRALIDNNPQLAQGNLTSLNNVQFPPGSNLPYVHYFPVLSLFPPDPNTSDYSGLSFQNARLEKATIKGKYHRCDFTNACLKDAILDHGSDFSFANFTNADLSGCIIRGNICGINVTGADLRGLSVQPGVTGGLSLAHSLEPNLFSESLSVPPSADTINTVNNKVTLLLGEGLVSEARQVIDSLVECCPLASRHYDMLADACLSSSEKADYSPQQADLLMELAFGLYRKYLECRPEYEKANHLRKGLIRGLVKTSAEFHWAQGLKQVLADGLMPASLIEEAVTLQCSRQDFLAALDLLQRALVQANKERLEPANTFVYNYDPLSRAIENLAKQCPELLPNCLSLLRSAMEMCITNEGGQRELESYCFARLNLLLKIKDKTGLLAQLEDIKTLLPDVYEYCLSEHYTTQALSFYRNNRTHVQTVHQVKIFLNRSQRNNIKQVK